MDVLFITDVAKRAVAGRVARVSRRAGRFATAVLRAPDFARRATRGRRRTSARAVRLLRLRSAGDAVVRTRRRRANAVAVPVGHFVVAAVAGFVGGTVHAFVIGRIGRRLALFPFADAAIRVLQTGHAFADVRSRTVQNAARTGNAGAGVNAGVRRRAFLRVFTSDARRRPAFHAFSVFANLSGTVRIAFAFVDLLRLLGGRHVPRISQFFRFGHDERFGVVQQRTRIRINGRNR